MKGSIKVAMACAVFVSGSMLSHGGTLYWDGNGAAAGAGVTPNGIWGSDPFWSTSESGDIVSSAYSSGSDVVFSAGNDSTGAYTVTVSGTQNAASLLFRSPGSTTLSGGTVQLAGGLSAQGGSATIASTIQLTGSQIWNVASGGTLSQTGNVTGSHTITKTGAGTLVINSSGTSMGGLSISEGRVNVTGAGVIGLSCQVTLANTAGAVLDFTGATGSKGLASLSGGGAQGGNVIAATTISFYGGAASRASYAGAISGVGGISMLGAGFQELSGLNTYAGPTTVARNGTISFNSIANVGGGASALGAPTSVYGGTILLGLASDGTGGTLLYTGTGHSTNRVIDLASTTGTGRLDASGTGALVFTGGVSANGAGSKVFNLTGSSTANNMIGGAIVDNSAVNKTTLQKTGAGKWILSGQNSYTGNTLVEEGTLFINGSTSAGSTVKVSQGATLGGKGHIHGQVELAGSITPGDGFETLEVGGVSFASTSSLNILLGRDSTGAKNGRVNSAGTVSIKSGASLTLSLASGLGSAAGGDIFFLLTNTSGHVVNGIFTQINGIATDLSDGSVFQWDSLDWLISYSADFASGSMSGGNDIAIRAIPEPGSLALGFGGAILALVAGKVRRGKAGRKL